MQTNPVKLSSDINPKPAVKTKFPSARYFQVHFEYLQELIDELKRRLDVTNEMMSQLQQKLNEIMPDSSEHDKSQH